MLVNGTNVSNAMGVTTIMLVSTVMGVTAHVSVSTMVSLMHSDPVAYVSPQLSFPVTHMATTPPIGNSMETRFPFMP